jgi:hypothetical protein
MFELTFRYIVKSILIAKRARQSSKVIATSEDSAQCTKVGPPKGGELHGNSGSYTFLNRSRQ